MAVVVGVQVEDDEAGVAAADDEVSGHWRTGSRAHLRRRLRRGGRGRAENAGGLSRRRGRSVRVTSHVGKTPWRPEAIHESRSLVLRPSTFAVLSRGLPRTKDEGLKTG